MRTRTIFVALSAAMVLAGCSESRSRQASRDLLERVRQVQELYSQALGLMASPMFSAGSTIFPVSKPLPVKPSAVELVTDQPVNPRVETVLATAQKDLTGAISTYRNAMPEDLAVAQALLGQIQALRGQCLLLRTQGPLGPSAEIQDQPWAQQARALLASAEDAARQVSREADRCVFIAQLGQMDTSQVQEAARQAQQRRQEISTQAQGIQQQIDQLSRQRDRLYQQDAQLSPQARQLRTDSQLASGRKGLDLAQQAMKIEADINRNELEAAALDFHRDMLSKQLADLTVQTQSLQDHLDMAANVMAGAEQARADRQAMLQQQRQTLADWQGRLQDSLAQLEKALGQLGQLQQQASDAFNSAVTSLKQAQAKRTGQPGAALLSQQASVSLAMAQLQSSQVRLGKRVAALTEQVAAANVAAAAAAPPEAPATAPAEVTLSYPPTDVRELAERARQNFDQAAQMYQRAASAVPPAQRWVYQAQQAAAKLALYQLSGDPAALDEARRLLEEALQGREASPYMTDVLELNQMAQGLSQQAPATSQPAATTEQTPAPAEEPSQEQPAAPTTGPVPREEE